MRVSLLQVLIAATTFSGALAIHCYSCQSVSDNRCLDPFKPYPEAVVDCESIGEQNATLCRTLTQESEFN